eukprot:GAHX01002558.1.p1 GENE.GAHX01002558.1~~GAHX01002558.1.p1  ORF type:complete len:242 (-),score=69.52 GAHX01002558.1:35-718(-)
MTNQSILWSIIGASETCKYLRKTADNKFCTNKYNLTGLCREDFCPLVRKTNTTITKKNKKVYLSIKTPQTSLFNKVDEYVHTELPTDKEEAIRYLKEHLTSEKAEVVSKCITKYILFTDYYKNKEKTKKEKERNANLFTTIYKKKLERKIIRREQRALRNAKLEKTVKDELLERLTNNVYEGIYSFEKEFIGEHVNDETNEIKEKVDIEEEEEELLDIEELELLKTK